MPSSSARAPADAAAAPGSPPPDMDVAQQDGHEGTAAAGAGAPGAGRDRKPHSGPDNKDYSGAAGADDVDGGAAAGDAAKEGEGAAPSEMIDDRPPLPDESVPVPGDDSWECQWAEATQTWFFYNRITGVSQWENPRVPSGGSVGATAADAGASMASAAPPAGERLVAGGYNPTVHGDYDPNAWYAQAYNQEQEAHEAIAAAAYMTPTSAAGYGETAGFNRFTGQFQAPGAGPSRHSDEAKSRRQMNAFFDVDAAANAHDGRSLKAERQNQKLSKAELKAYKEKRHARKEEKRRAWLME